MDVKAATRGLTKYLIMLVHVIVFPLVWMKAIKVAKAHKEFDPKGMQKVAVSILVGLLFAGGIYMYVDGKQTEHVDGMYESLDGRLQVATLESEYNDALALIDATEFQIATITKNLGAAEAARDAATTEEGRVENQTIVDGLQETLETAETTLQTTEDLRDSLIPNHNFYLSLVPMINDKDDAGIKQALTTAPETVKQGKATKAFAIKDDAYADMNQFYTYFVLPGLFGHLLGPLFIALGSILKNGFEPSDTVGFKPYPGASMGWFLILGGFGIPAAFFAAWAMVDVEGRTIEPQIAL